MHAPVTCCAGPALFGRHFQAGAAGWNRVGNLPRFELLDGGAGGENGGIGVASADDLRADGQPGVRVAGLNWPKTP
jgi:hypothetical protein